MIRIKYKINQLSDDVIESVLLSRNLTNDMVNNLLLSNEKNYEPSENYPNIHKAYERIMKAVEDNELIYILLDPDCDGFCSGGIIFDFLYSFLEHDEICYLIHEKKRKSHGIDEEIFNKIKEKPCGLLLCPDSSSSDSGWHKKIYELGCDIVVMDHHIYDEEEVFYKSIIVNNQCKDVNNQCGSGALVTKKVVDYICKMEGMNIGSYYNDLVAISLVSDVCDLRNLENRYYLNVGSKVENITNDLIKTFVNKLKIKDRMTITDMSFNMINKINVIIRSGSYSEVESLFESMIGSRETVNYKYKGKTFEESIQSSIIRIGNRLGQRQRNLIKKTIQEGMHTLTNEQDSILILDGKYIDNKISGLLATKLCNEYKKCTMVLSEHDGILSGSCRGYGVDSLNDLCKISGLCISVEGHQNAFGLNLLKSNLGEFIKFMNTKIGENRTSDEVEVDYIYYNNIPLNDLLDVGDLENLWCSPYIPRPKFIIKDMKIDSNKIIKRGINLSYKDDETGVLYKREFCSKNFFDDLVKIEENPNCDKMLNVNLLCEVKKSTYSYVNILEAEVEVIN